jgi:hypothetical protein
LPSNLNDSSVKYHNNEDGYVHDLSRIESDNNTIVVIVPCNPSFHLVIPHKLNNLRNIITIDMEVPPSYSTSFEDNPCFLANIKTKNQDACEQIAKQVSNFFSANQFSQVNVIICEGNFHSRGKLFKEYIDIEIKNNLKITVNFIPENNLIQELNFGNAINEASNFVFSNILNLAKNSQLRLYPTFIFCANDNMGIGARNALIKAKLSFSNDDNKLRVIRNTKIICYDYSSTIKNYIENFDEFIYFSSGQNYIGFAQKIINISSGLEGGKRTDIDKYRKELTIPPIFKMQ